MYRFALRPAWIVSHLLVLLLVVTMLNLGLWQLRRLDERRAANRLVAARMAEPTVDVGALLSPEDPYTAAAAVAERRVRAAGVYQGDQQVLVRGASLDGTPGSWVLTPLERADGTLVIVNRGWIANNGAFDAVPAAYAPPAGEVVVTGLLRQTDTRGRFGPSDPEARRVTSLARADIARYAQQLEAPVVPAWVQLQSTQPAPASSAARLPRILDPPELDQGPHFSYAMQWFIFSAIAIIGYPLILRRNARERNRGGDQDDAEPPPID